jgi:hypothetical protein
VARIPGTPLPATLGRAFGDANGCKSDASTHTHSTAEEDRQFYTYLQRAMQALQVIVTPDLDVGFASGVNWFAENISSFVANGTPMTMVTRAISRFLLQAQRQRNQELMFGDESGEEMLCFKETAAVAMSKVRLLEWNRDAQIDQQIQWTRCYEQATGVRGGGGQSRGRYDGNTGTGGAKQGSYDGRVKLEGGGTQGGASGTKSTLMKINYNKIDKQKWRHAYGETRVNGKVVLMCWYYCNRPGGCVKQKECVHEHTVYPKEYKGKALEKCSEDFQREVLKKCVVA